MNKPPELAVIVNSFNRLTLLQDGLPALVQALQNSPLTACVVVFDAGSTDGSRQWLHDFQQQSPIAMHILLPEAGHDTSFSAGVNASCNYAQQNFPQLQYILLYETDNWIAGGEPLVLACDFLQEHPDMAAVGFTVSKHSGQPSGVGCSFPTVWQFLWGPQLSHWMKLDRPQLIPGGDFKNHPWWTADVVYTSPILVRRTAWQQSQGFDALAFPFSDCDIDWSWRVWKQGWKIAVLQVDGVVHDNKEELSGWSGNRVVVFHRARLKLLRQHFGEWIEGIKPILLLRHCLEWLVLLPMVLCGKRDWQSLRKRWSLITGVFANYENR